MNKIIKRILEYTVIVIICAIISSLVFAYEFQEYDTYFDQQMVLNTQLVEAIEILVERVAQMKNMRGI